MTTSDIEFGRLDPHDLLSLVQGANAVFRTSEGRMEQDYPLLFAPHNLRHWLGARSAGRVVSAIGVVRKPIFTPAGAIPAALIGSVFTLAPYRRQGLATRLFTMAVEGLREAGVELALISGDQPSTLR